MNSLDLNRQRYAYAYQRRLTGSHLWRIRIFWGALGAGIAGAIIKLIGG